jgi:hypothetical protein
MYSYSNWVTRHRSPQPFFRILQEFPYLPVVSFPFLHSHMACDDDLIIGVSPETTLDLRHPLSRIISNHPSNHAVVLLTVVGPTTTTKSLTHFCNLQRDSGNQSVSRLTVFSLWSKVVAVEFSSIISFRATTTCLLLPTCCRCYFCHCCCGAHRFVSKQPGCQKFKYLLATHLFDWT